MAKAKGDVVSRFYEIKGDKVVRKRKFCPRCGEGVFLAEHKDRRTCGKCGYTEFKK
ncbi:MAG TPA: 30S ribosomal protein S27ae [Archaeoglobus veneficus]|nr:MAG: 30S ribosomal protein S27ae [Archaeoglobales archaeon]HDM60356.1 30S ribosomal protein S27ae [Archaeoglobus veneficus]